MVRTLVTHSKRSIQRIEEWKKHIMTLILNFNITEVIKQWRATYAGLRARKREVREKLLWRP